MTYPALPMHIKAGQAGWPSFEIRGKVTGLLPGAGLAVVRTAGRDEFTLNRDTDGVHFDTLRVGQLVRCQVAVPGHRVLHAHQQTRPMRVQAEPEKAAIGTMTKDELIDEHCRRWGVQWRDISQYRVVVPHSDGVGWTMENVGQPDDSETLHCALKWRART